MFMSIMQLAAFEQARTQDLFTAEHARHVIQSSTLRIARRRVVKRRHCARRFSVHKIRF